jgi:mono/diheme cytochrome c family protein
MRKIYFVSISFILFTVSCNKSPHNSFNKFLNKDHLASQIFNVNINRDTTLVTNNGCIINITKGSLQSENENVKLEIKEALKNTDIVLAGLTTISGKQPLSSGGMMYINATPDVTIKKELELLIPTKDYNPDMKVFKGVDSAGKTDWQQPETLPEDSTILAIQNGEAIFKVACSNCHKLNDDYTGPALPGVSKRYKKQWIYNFMKNPSKMIAIDQQAMQLFQKWKPTVMTAFPALTHREIDNILAYAETRGNFKRVSLNKTNSRGDSSFLNNSPCDDSCRNYLNALENIEEMQIDINQNQEEFFSLDRTLPIPPKQPLTLSQKAEEKEIKTTEPIIQKEYVAPSSITATFYTVNVKSFGWFNIDILTKEQSNCKPSELFVTLNTDYQADFSVMLIIPSVKAFIEGGKLKNDLQYGFDETNGTISLPQEAQCHIIAFAEKDGKLIFGKADFFAAKKQTITISFAETTKEGLSREIKSLNLDGIAMDVNDAKNAGKLREVNNKTSEAEKLRPKNCDCGLPDKNPIPTLAVP